MVYLLQAKKPLISFSRFFEYALQIFSGARFLIKPSSIFGFGGEPVEKV